MTNLQDICESSTPRSASEQAASGPNAQPDIHSIHSQREPSIVQVAEEEIRNYQPQRPEQHRQRASLTETERLLLVPLCCSRGEEYLQGKEKFWTRQTEKFNHTTEKSIANARTIVMRLLKKYRAKYSKVSIIYIKI